LAQTFEVIPLRFFGRARSDVVVSGNWLRGRFGKSLRNFDEDVYNRLFAPRLVEGPSGLKDAPRPFVFRVAERPVRAGEPFDFGFHLFDPREPLDSLVRAFGEIAEIERVEGGELRSLPLVTAEAASRVRVTFLTPTELKGAWGADPLVRSRSPDRPGRVQEERDPGIARGPGGPPPNFGLLFGRIRDRVSTLRALYQGGPIDIDFKAMGGRAAQIKMTRCEIRHVEAERTSRRTGQTHSLGGFVGVAEYEGDLGEFLPYLEIARWTGVGRQTVWGKGEIGWETF
jgi:hypothetical protein